MKIYVVIDSWSEHFEGIFTIKEDAINYVKNLSSHVDINIVKENRWFILIRATWKDKERDYDTIFKIIIKELWLQKK